MLAEKYIRLYNRLDGKPSSREKLVRLHAQIKSEIDAKRIDKHSPLGIELFSIESRLATAIASIDGPFDVEEIKVKKIDINAYVKLAGQAQAKPKVIIRKVVKTVIRKVRVKAKVEKPAKKSRPANIMADDNKFFLKASAKAAQAADFILDRLTKEETVPTPSVEPKQKQTVDRSPVPGRKARSETATRVISATALAGMEFETLPFEGKWKEHLGIPSKNFSAMVWGKPKQGKTHYAFQLADYVSQFGSVLYVLSDEGVGHTVKEKIRQNGLDKNDQVSFIETRQVSEVTKALDSGNYKFVVLDLISNMKQDEENLSPDQFHALRKRYPAISFIPVFSSTKAGNFRGTQDWGHDVDVLVDVENGIATAQGRFGGGEYKIFPDAGIEKEPIKPTANPVKEP